MKLFIGILCIALAAAQSTWTRCASENQQCSFVGKKLVIYGYGQSMTAEKVFENGVACNNGVFGDPAYGFGKACFIKDAWTRCASEGTRCSFTGKKIVRYGDLASNRWAAERIVDGWIDCTNGVWGDPAYGIGKACFVRDLEWTRCASENGRCNFLGHKLMKYGDLATNKFSEEKLVYNGADCSNGVWGDPAYGIGKACYISDPPLYMKCASENQRCAFQGPMIVRYGDLVKNQWAKEQVFVGGTPCTNTVFGDPIVGTVKQCYVRALPWTKCATEGGRCAFSGRKMVRYGDLASNRFARDQAFLNGVDCTNGVFGDPAYGIGKACYVVDWAPPTSLLESNEQTELSEKSDTKCGPRFFGACH